MALRKDKVQLSVEINGKKAGKSYGDLIKSSRTLKKELLALKPGTDAFIKKSAELKKVNSRLSAIRKQTAGVKKGLSSLSVAGLVASVALGLRSMFNFGKETLRLFNIQAQADAQLKAAIKSTNGAAQKSYDDLKKSAAGFQKESLFGDEQIQKAQATLLTFTKIQGDTFDEATKNVLDYSQRLGVDLQSASIQVGKALNDPIKGVTALGRAGVQFTESQKATIRTLQETGDLAGAQAIVLKELETQFGGSAKAASEAGLGGYTLLKNRVGDIQEAIGGLATSGGKFLLPFFNKAVSFAEAFTDSLVSGEKATGQYGSAINFITGAFEILFKGWQFGFSVVKSIIATTGELITSARQLPIIGTVINAIIGTFSTLFDIISDGSASFAGLQAAANQAIDNIKRYINGAIASFKIFAKEADLAFTINQNTRERLKKEIQALKDLKEDAANSGKTIGQAYVEARDKAIAETTTKRLKEKPETYSPPVISPTNLAKSGSTTTKSGAAGHEKRSPIEALRSIASRNSPDTIAASSGTLAKDRLEQLEKATQEELLLHEKAYLERLFTEEEYGIKKLELLAEQKQGELNLLAAFGLQESDQYLQIEVDKLNAEKSLSDERIAVKKREADMKRRIEQEGIAAFGEVIDTGIGLLAKDEAAKKRSAIVTKSFEAAKVTVNSVREISEIYKSFAGLGPIGQILAALQAVRAGTRAVKAISSIKAQQFYLGGAIDIPHYSSQLITGPQNVPSQKGGDNILAYVKRGETVINDQQRERLGGIEAMRMAGVPGYNGGGFVDVNTTPSSSTIQSVGTAVSDNEAAQTMSELKNAIGQFSSVLIHVVENGIHANLSYGEVKAKEETLAKIQELAAL